MIAAILPLAGANGDPKGPIALASLLALMVWAIMVLAAVAKLGFIADLISKPTALWGLCAYGSRENVTA